MRFAHVTPADSTIQATAFVVLALVCAPHAAGQASNAALRFFGTGVAPPGQQDRVRIPIDDNTPGPDASAPCDLGAGSFTIDFWVRGNLADNNTANSGGDAECFCFNWIDGNIVIDRDIYGASSRDWGISLAGGFVRFGTGRADVNPLDSEHTLEGNTQVLDGSWHHIAVVRDAATGVKSIFIDALLDIASPPNRSRDDISYPNNGDPSPVTPWGPYIVLAAEKHDAGAEYPSFNGFMDDVRFWNRALTQPEILERYNRVAPANTPGLVGMYRFEESAGTIIADSSGSASPTGQLIAGVPGNGEWVTRAQNPLNVAPVNGTFTPACPGDADGDSAVGLPDIAAIIQQWAQTIAPPGAGPDLDASGQVGLGDISLVITNWGRVCST